MSALRTNELLDSATVEAFEAFRCGIVEEISAYERRDLAQDTYEAVTLALRELDSIAGRISKEKARFVRGLSRDQLNHMNLHRNSYTVSFRPLTLRVNKQINRYRAYKFLRQRGRFPAWSEIVRLSET